MNLGKLRSGRIELAVCILVPLVVLVAIVVPGRMFCLDRRNDLAARQACLEQAPKMEVQLAEARNVLKAFAEASADGDKASELTSVSEKAAQNFGFTTRSANVEKQPGTGTEAWADYKVMLNGSGSLKAIVGMLDFLEHPSQRLQVKQVAFKSGGAGKGAPYDGNVVLASRTVVASAVSGTGGGSKAVTTAQAAEQSARLHQLAGAVKAWADEKRAPLLAVNPETSKGNETPGPVKSSRLFILNGIARDKMNPLVMTDRGVFGIGEKVDGYTIVAIGDDRVVLVDQGGRRETVTLYRDGDGK